MEAFDAEAVNEVFLKVSEGHDLTHKKRFNIRLKLEEDIDVLTDKRIVATTVLMLSQMDGLGVNLFTDGEDLKLGTWTTGNLDNVATPMKGSHTGTLPADG